LKTLERTTFPLTMTNNDEFRKCDNNGFSESISQTKSPANQELSLNPDETHAKSNNSPADEGITYNEMLEQQCLARTPNATSSISSSKNTSNSKFDDDSKDDKSAENGSHNKPSTISQAISPANEETFVGTEQSHTECVKSCTEEYVPCEEMQAQLELDYKPSDTANNLSTKGVANRLFDVDLLDVLEHCFDELDFASIFQHENSMKTLKEIFSSHTESNENLTKKSYDKDNNNIISEISRKYLKSQCLRKRRFLKQLIEDNNTRIKLEKLIQKSDCTNGFVTKREREMKSRKHQALIDGVTTIPKSSRNLCDDRSVADERSESFSKNDGDGDGDVNDDDENDSKGILIDNSNKNGDCNEDYCRIVSNIDDDQEKEHIVCASNNSRKAEHESTECTPRNKMLMSNQEDNNLLPIDKPSSEVHDKNNTECLVHMDDRKDHEELLNDLRVLNSSTAGPCVDKKEPFTMKNLVVGKDYPDSIIPHGSSSGICNKRNCHSSVELDMMHEEIYDEKELDALLPSPEDQYEHNESDSKPAARKDLKKRYDSPENHSPQRNNRISSKQKIASDIAMKKRINAPTINFYDNVSQRSTNPRRLRPSPKSITDPPIAHKNNSGTNEEIVPIKTDSGSFCRAIRPTTNDDFLSNSKNRKRGMQPKFMIGSSDADELDGEASTLLLVSLEETRSVAMSNDSMRTCDSREVALGGPSSEEKGLNLMESSISNILKAIAKKNRSQYLHCLYMTTIAIFAIIGIFALGALLGFMSHIYWNFYQVEEDIP